MESSYNGYAEAAACLERAEKLLPSDTNLRYACLELRLAIEHFVLDQLKIYLQETPDDALKKWTPRELISEMLSVDRSAEGTATYFVRPETSSGMPTEQPIPIGIDRHMSLKWANQAHNALSNLSLHVPTYDQLERGKALNPSAVRDSAMEIMKTMRDLLSGPYFRANFGNFLEFKCVACSRLIRRRVSSIFSGEITCPNRDCGAQYIVAPDDSGTKTAWRLKQGSIQCVQCGNTIWIDAHRACEDAEFACCACQSRYRFKLLAVPQPIDGADAQAQPPHHDE